jgi:hypothetical protein
VGLQADASYLDSSGNFTCMQASAQLIGSNCQVSPRVLASLTGRVGYLIDPLGRTLLYGKGGGAWMGSDISITPNHTGYPTAWDAPNPGDTANGHGNAWGGTVGAGIARALTPAWSVGLEYDYYRFATANTSTPNTISSSGTDDPAIAPTFRTIAGGRSAVTSDMQVIKLALNYHWTQDPRAAWADAPVFGVGNDAGQGAPRPNPTGVGGRCRHTLLVQQRQGKKHEWRRHPYIAAHLQQSDRTESFLPAWTRHRECL